MRVRITRPWSRLGHAFPTSIIGRVVDIRESLAKYLIAMHCAERARRRRVHISSKLRWRLIPHRSVAEARIRIAGQWHRLRLELDDAILRECAFYRDRRGFAR